ncbi:uncharacterized protein LOC126808776 isoform X1 [Patella vulgata]|uniref:uncharacterized protein LOC126808776 isoform X1 n=1 Tax=Patella vulgata TaxID=6465 RepID=UPI0024A96112|nr:uncharacterized protein LOC126808776 isoform X1 [Patella vulgata]
MSGKLVYPVLLVTIICILPVTAQDPCFNNPCLNNGSCMREGSTYTCSCMMDYTGKNCEILPQAVLFGSDTAANKTTTTSYPDKCYGNPCLYNGTCIKLENGDFKCNCLPEYYGKMCEFEYTFDFPCNGSYCRNGGSCINSTCYCQDGYDGKSCEFMSTAVPAVTQPNRHANACNNITCYNEGSCFMDNGNAYCYCFGKYTGMYCETIVETTTNYPSTYSSTNGNEMDCYGMTCYNGASCVINSAGPICKCVGQYTGKSCDTAMPSTPPTSPPECNNYQCYNGGSCFVLVGLPTCNCSPGFTGMNCLTRLTSSNITTTTSGPGTNCNGRYCQNGGSCRSLSNRDYCVCGPGYYGEWCQFYKPLSTTSAPLNYCNGSYCQNGGSCRSSSNGHYCHCGPGYYGEWCQYYNPLSTSSSPLNYCNGSDCQNGGSCWSSSNGDYCHCGPDYYGKWCQYYKSSSTTAGPGTYCNGSYCQNGGSCWSSNDGDYCSCRPGYFGQLCQYWDYNTNCGGSYCQNGGYCYDSAHGRYCVCFGGTSGQFCQFNASMATPEPDNYCYGGHCQNGGTCLTTANGKACYCTAGYTGQWCDWYNTSSNGNVTSNPNHECNGGYCQNRGTCQGSPNGDYCSCEPGYKGQWCELQITLSTTAGPSYFCNGGYCHNGASCWGSPSGDYCNCGPGYTGKWCESVMCNGGVCYNDGWCMNSTNGEYCTCQYGYTGAYCETMTETSHDNSCSQRIYECSKIVANYGSQAMLNPEVYCRVTKEFMNCYYNVSDICSLEETVVSAFNQSRQTYDQLCYGQDTSCLNEFLQCGNLSLQSAQYAFSSDKMLFCSYTRRAIDCFGKLEANDNCTVPNITSQMRTSHQDMCPDDNTSSCPPGLPVANCFIDPCLLASCPGHPNAICRANYCGVCSHDYYDEYNRMVNCNNATTLQEQRLQCSERFLECASNLTTNYSGNNFLNPDNYCKLAKESLNCSEQVLRDCSNVMNLSSELRQSRQMYQQNCEDGVTPQCLQEMLRCSNYSMEATRLITTSGITNTTLYCSLLNDYLRCAGHLRNCSNFTSAMEQAKSYVQNLCGQVMDPCMNNPCSNGGSCFNDMNSTRGYTCQCYEGRYGDNCQARLCDYFTSDPCGPYGKCLGLIETGDMCTCPLKREGIFCEVNDYESVYGECPKRRRLIKYIMEILGGKTPTPYQLNTSVSHILRDINVSWLQMPNCTDRGTYSPIMMEFNVFNLTQKIYYCVDPYGDRLKYSYESTQQPNCSAVVNGLCNSNPCRNEGVCHMSYDYNNESYWCECKPGFYGSTCEVSVCAGLEINPCSSKGGLCLGDLETGKFCNCPAGITGPFCDRSGNDSLLTTCQRLHELSVVAEQYLNGSLTISFFNVGQMIRDMASNINMKTMWRPSCSGTGKPLNVGCTVDILNTTRKLCYCTDGHYQPLPDARPSYDGLPNCSRSNSPNITTDMKPGMCPRVAPGTFGIGIQECNNDHDCGDNLKCCSNGFGYQCLRPVNQSHTNCSDFMSNCLNGGTCLRREGRYMCNCPVVYSGPRCEIRVQTACDDNPCKNGASCQAYPNGDYSCSCSSSWGKNCEYPSHDNCNCTFGNRCVLRERCQGNGYNYTNCFVRKECQDVNIYDPCGSQPCSENAVCVISANGGHRCQCKEGFSGDNCYINKMICERSNLTARCQMNDQYSECIGDVKNGLLCKCSTTRSGIFCEIPHPQEQTRCEQRRAFYRIAFGPVTPNSMMIRHLMNMTEMTSKMEVNCTSDGSFSPVQCVDNYDMYSNNKTRKCYCVDEQGRNKSSLVSYPGYPPCTAPNITKDISQIICTYPIAMNLCWNHGRCLGDIFHGRICECAPGFSGIFCQRSGNSSVQPNSLCTLGRETFNLVTRINKGNFSWVSDDTIIEPGSIGLPEGVNITNTTEQITNMVLSSFGSMVSPLIDMIHSSFIPSPNCTQSGGFKPRQCEVNINNGSIGDCYCVFRNGTEQQGTRMRYPDTPYCYHLDNETDGVGCIPAVCGQQCRYGLRRNVKGCEICECRTPCEGFPCASGSKCVTEETYICGNTWSPCDRPVCKPVTKPSKCPNELLANVKYLINMYRNIYESCDTTCINDAECPDDLKCCPGCGMKCVKPLEKKTCLSHHKQVMHQIDLYKNLTMMLSNSSISSQIQSEYPNMLDAGYHWMKNMTMLWKPHCSEAGEYLREQCYYNMSGNADEPMKCFCVDHNGGMIDDTHNDVTNTTYSLFTCSEFKPGVCPTEGPGNTSCTQDYDCNGQEKCCGRACQLPSHKQPGRVNMTVPNLCDINVNLCNTTDLSAQCVGNWQDGHLCNCRQNGGPVCLAPQSSVIKMTACEKKRAVMELMKGGFSGQLQGIKASEYNLTTETLQRGLGDRYYNLSVMAATCKPNGKFDDIQCDVNIFTNQMERCYCVNSKGHRILGTEGKAFDTLLCSNMCPIGEPLKNGTSYIRCGQGVPCGTGYSCNLQKIASTNGDYYDEGYCCSNQTKSAPEGSCPAKPPRYGESKLCKDQCSQDRNCSSGRKCCLTSCGKKCILAREEQPTFRNEPCRPGLKPLQRSGESISCGRGSPGFCPSGSYCDIAPDDSFAVCCPDEPMDVCSILQDSGMCFGYMPRWFFNKENGRCEEFIFGGCGGNDNNFNTQEECCNSCGANGCKKDECPAVKKGLATCVDMCRTDADCKGSELCCSNGCGQTCTIATKNATSTCFQELEKVALQMKSGQLSQCSSFFIPRCNMDGTWKSQQCWDSFGMCWCVLPNGTKVTQPTRGTVKCPRPAETRIIDQPVSSNMQVCNGNESVHCCNPDLCKMTHCPANLHAVCRINPCGTCSVEFYDSNQKVDCTAGLSRCEHHRYEALTARYRHGMNNMTSKPLPQLTDNTVNNTIPTFTPRDIVMRPVCEQPKVTGMCRAYFARWYYNSTTFMCETFVYGGCGGNDNNFETAEQCFHKCNQQMNPCKDVKCEVNEQCRIQPDNPNCFSGPCRLNGECIKVHPEPRMSGVFMPTCTEDKDYQYKQCQDNYCWCVNRDGVMFDSSLTKEPLECNEAGPVTEVQTEVCPGNSSVANKDCIDACASKICPDHPDARCSVDLCSSNCSVKFVNRAGHEVTCGDDVCKVIQATPHKDCSTPVVCPGGGAPLLCPSDVCSRASCPGNPCAVCSIDPCRCKAVFTDIVTKEIITDCQKVTTSSCRINVCEAMIRKNRADLMGIALEYNWSPACDDAGRYQTKQCNMSSCWCVDGSGRLTAYLQDAAASCVRNETASVVVIMKFQQNFNQVSSKLSEFERAVLEMWNDMDLGKYVDSIEIRAGSVLVETTFKDKNADSTIAPNPILNMIPVLVENKIKNREAVLDWNGEEWVADDQYFESRRVFEAQTGGEKPPEPAPETELPLDRNLIVVIVVACVVIVAVATGIVVWACCCRKPKKEQYIEDTLDNVSSGSNKSSPQPPFGVSNQLYMTDSNKSLSKLHFDEDFESEVVKYKL